jgi:hypothetical protein
MRGIEDRGERSFGANVPMPSLTRFLAGKAEIMALAERRRTQQLVPVRVRA